MKPRILRFKAICAAFGLALILTHSTRSAPAAEQPFYAGKTLRIIAGFAPGGTIDLRARIFARHLPKWIPGNPNIIVQNMPGAGGLVAANYVFTVADPDGLAILHFPSSTVMNTFLTTTNVKYDIRQVPIIWLGSDSWLTVINPKTTQVRRAEDILRSTVPLRVGGSGATSLRSLRPKLALELFGVNHTWVTGYGGSAELLLAFDRGEIHLFEDPQDGYKTNIQPKEKDGTAAVLWQTGILTPEETFRRADLLAHVPTLAEVLPKEKQKGPAWEAWKAAVIPQAFQYSVGVAPGVPPDRIAILTHAFGKMTQDPAFLEDFEKALKEPLSGTLLGEKADRVVKDAVKKLLQDYQAGIRYLLELGKKS
jgi:tripartite-type tricarboxylate transporter receptor subunit TctC